MSRRWRMSAVALHAFGKALYDGFTSDPNGVLPLYYHTWWELSQLYAAGDLTEMDLGCFAGQAARQAPSDAIKAAANNLITALIAADVDQPQGSPSYPYPVVPCTRGSYPWGLHTGLSIYYPCETGPAQDYWQQSLMYDFNPIGQYSETWLQLIDIGPLGYGIGYAEDAYDPDGTTATATPLGYYDTTDPPTYRGKHWFHQPDDTDVYSFDAVEGGIYAVGIQNAGPNCHPWMYLLDRNGAAIQMNDAAGMQWECPTSPPGTPGYAGTYYVAVVQSDASEPGACEYGGTTYYDVGFTLVNAFSDVRSDFWAGHEVSSCRLAGIVQGSDGSYMPGNTVTHDQMAVFMARSLAKGDANVPEYLAAPDFPDVPSTNWAFKYIEYCKAQGIVGGYADGYHPELPVDRGQMAAFIARAVCGGDAAVPAGSPVPHFNDVPTDFWAYKYIDCLRSLGLAGGYGGNMYCPNDPVTRDQMAVFVYRAFLRPRDPYGLTAP